MQYFSFFFAIRWSVTNALSTKPTILLLPQAIIICEKVRLETDFYYRILKNVKYIGLVDDIGAEQKIVHVNLSEFHITELVSDCHCYLRMEKKCIKESHAVMSSGFIMEKIENTLSKFGLYYVIPAKYLISQFNIQCQCIDVVKLD